MKLSDLRAETQTTFKPLASDGEELGIVITGHTFATEEWRTARSKHSVDDDVYVSHSSGLRVGGPLEENELKAVASLVTNIEGIDDWAYSPKAVSDLFTDPAYASIPQQFHAHLKALGNGIKNQKKGP